MTSGTTKGSLTCLGLINVSRQRQTTDSCILEPCSFLLPSSLKSKKLRLLTLKIWFKASASKMYCLIIPVSYLFSTQAYKLHLTKCGALQNEGISMVPNQWKFYLSIKNEDLVPDIFSFATHHSKFLLWAWLSLREAEKKEERSSPSLQHKTRAWPDFGGWGRIHLLERTTYIFQAHI